MVAGIKEYHIKKFSRLVQELEQLRQDIQEYCPEAVYRLNTCQSLELGMDPGQFDDYPYVVAEDLLCDAINQIVIEKRGRVTNEDVIRAMFPNARLVNCNDNTVGLRMPNENWIIWFDEHWFYSPYEKKEIENDRKG